MRCQPLGYGKGDWGKSWDVGLQKIFYYQYVICFRSKSINSTINNIENREPEEELANCSIERTLTVTPPLESNCEINISNEIINSVEPVIK